MTGVQKYKIDLVQKQPPLENCCIESDMEKLYFILVLCLKKTTHPDNGSAESLVFGNVMHSRLLAPCLLCIVFEN